MSDVNQTSVKVLSANCVLSCTAWAPPDQILQPKTSPNGIFSRLPWLPNCVKDNVKTFAYLKMHMQLQCKEIFPKIMVTPKKNGKWPVAQNLPKRLPGCSGGAVRSEPLRGEEQWRRGGGRILPELFGGTSHRQAGMPYVLVR